MTMHAARVAPEKTDFSARPAAVLFPAERMEKRMATYWEQLKDPRWQRRRLEIMQRDEFVCRICYDAESTLNVHHKHYFKGRAPWEYEDHELVTLCEHCHEAQHERDADVKEVLARLHTDGPHNIDEAVAMIAGWSHDAIGYDASRFQEQAKQAFAIGQLAEAFYEHFDPPGVIAWVADMLRSASRERYEKAMSAFVSALKVE